MRITKLAALAILATASVANANLLVNGDFETEPNFGINGDGSYTLLTGTQLPGWTIADGHGVTIHNHGYPYISGTYSVNMDGEGYDGRNADFSQAFPTDAGTTYQLDYDYSTWTFNSSLLLHVELSDSSGLFFAGIYPNPSVVTHNSTSFVSIGGDVTLRVYETGSGYNDNSFIVDNFSVVALPEPSTAMLGAPALLLLARRRR